MRNAILCTRKLHFFVLVLVIVNPRIFDLPRLLTSLIFVLNSLLKLLGHLKTWITSRLVYVLLIAQFNTENNRFEFRFDTDNNIKV